MKIYSILIVILSVSIVNAAQQQAQDYTQQLPRELKGLVAGYMSSAQNIEQVTENIRSLMRANKQWNQVLNDQQVLGGLIKDLAQRFNIPIPLAAAELGTPKAFESLWREILKDNSGTIEKGFDESLNKAVSMRQKPNRDSIIRFLVKAGANIDKEKYLQAALYPVDPHLFKLLISLGNKQINTEQDADENFYSGILGYALRLYLSSKNSPVKEEQEQAKKYEEIIKLLLKEGAIPGEETRWSLENLGFIED